MTLIPTQVTFRGLEHDDEIEQVIRDRVSWLEQFYSGIVRCRVVVEVPHRHHRDGRHFHVQIEMTVPAGAPIIVNHEPSLHGGLRDTETSAHHKDTETEGARSNAAVAIHEAFDVARRQLEDFAREQRGA